MAPRRKTFRRNSSANAVMRRRLGLTGWGNSKRFFGWSKTLNTRTLGEGHNPGTTTGAHWSLPINNWNDPLGTLGTLVAGTGSLTANRHPMDHDNAIASGYNRAQVLSWKAEIEVNWIGGASNVGDYLVAYTISQDVNTEVTLVAGTVSRLERMELETNPRWTLKRFSSTPGLLDGPRKRNLVTINIPNVFKYADTISKGSGATAAVEANNATVSHIIQDVASSTEPPQVAIFCTVVIMSETGAALGIDNIHVTVAITQRVKIMRDFIGSEDMDDGEPDVHA